MIVESPLTPDGHLLNAVHDGLETWSRLNPGLELRYVETGEANIKINFMKGDMNNALGEACMGCLYTIATESFIELYSGFPNEGAVVLVNACISDYKTLRNTVAHEFGHNLGLHHHQSTDHLMGKGARNDIQIPYDELGYNIPKPLAGSACAVDGFCSIAVNLGYPMKVSEVHNLAAIAVAGIISVGVVVTIWRRVGRTGTGRQHGQPIR